MIVFIHIHFAVDFGIDVGVVSHNWGCQMAGPWMADLGGY